MIVRMRELIGRVVVECVHGFEHVCVWGGGGGVGECGGERVICGTCEK